MAADYFNESKRIYFEQLENSSHLRNLPLHTRKSVEEKLKILINCPSASTNLKVIYRDGKPRLQLKCLSSFLEVLTIEDAFDVVYEKHVECNHADASFTREAVTCKYSVPMMCVQMVIDSCLVCNPQLASFFKGELSVKNGTDRGVWRMNIVRDLFVDKLVSGINTRYLLIYKENSTNFTVLRPLFGGAGELSIDLFHLFVEFGYPEKVIVPDLIDLYINIFQIVHAINPITKVMVHKIANDIFETDKKEVMSELDNWQKANNSSYWDQGCLFVQYKMNKTLKYIRRMETQKTFLGIPFNLFFNIEASEEINSSVPSTSEDSGTNAVIE